MIAWLLLTLALGIEPVPPGARISTPQEAFDFFRALEGEWEGSSTKGWTDKTSFRTIAGGSVVVSTSFDAHPGETMMTMFHLDSGRLLLTHYCVAKNQPRLAATTIEPKERRIVFTWLDGTGLASRDTGHMDQAVFEFQDPDHFTSKWTWYQNGTERWMEEIRYARVR